MRLTSPQRTPERKHYSDSLSRLMLTTALVGVVSIGGTQALAGDPIFIENHQGINYTNESEVSTTDLGAIGINLISGNSFIDPTDGAIPGGNVSLSNNVGGNISTGGEYAYGIEARAAAGSVSINNGATVSTTGEGSSAIHGFSGNNGDGEFEASYVGGDVSITNSGTVTTEENFAYGIVGKSNGGEVTINNSGTVSTAEDQSWGLEISSGAASYGGDMPGQVGADITVLNSGTISTMGSDSYGIYMSTIGGDIQVDLVTGSDVSTTGENSQGLYATSVEFGATNTRGDIVANLAGTISTQGFYAAGAYLETQGGNITFNSSAAITIAGDNSTAIQVNTYGGAAQIDLLAGSSISTTGENSQGLYAFSGTYDNTHDGGDIVANLAGTISTQGFYSAGAFVDTQGGDITFSSSAAITIAGDDSRAIELNASDYYTNEDGESETGGNVTATNLGALSTTGDRSVGIDAASNGGAIDVTNKGAITTTGNDALGITLRSENYSTGDGATGGTITLTNSVDGRISTEGENSGAIYATTTANTINIDNSAELSTKGIYSSGINVYSTSVHQGDDQDRLLGGDITIANSGMITTAGQSSTGINGSSDGGMVSVDNSGSILTANEGSYGIFTSSNSTYDFDGNLISKGGDLNLVNSGSITTSGQFANGLQAHSDGGKVTVNNSGSVSTTNEDGFGIHLSSNGTYDFDGNTLTNGGDLKLVNSGSVSNTAGNSGAIWLHTDGGAIQIDLLAGSSISTNGENSQGLHAVSGGYGAADTGGDVNAVLAGTISTQGFYSAGAFVETQGGDITFSSSAAITVAGDDSRAIELNASDHFTNEDGESETGGNITATNLGALSTTGDRSIAIDAASNGGAIDVTNKGAITTTGSDAVGIALRAESYSTGDGVSGGTINLTNSVDGDISNEGENSGAIYATTTANTINIDNSAELSTKGIYSSGINVYSTSVHQGDDQDPLLGGDITIANSGMITTTGQSSTGINGSSDGGMVSVDNSGSILTANEGSYGIFTSSNSTYDFDGNLISKGGDLNLKNSGSVTTTEANSTALELNAHGGALQIDLLAGSTVSTIGENSQGLRAFTGEYGAPDSGGDIVANLAGTISTQGFYSAGAYLETQGGDITFTSSAAITVAGDDSRAIELNASDHFTNEDGESETGGNITATNLGDISTSGHGSIGIEAVSHGGDVRVTNRGEINSGISGIFAVAGGDLDVTNDGDINLSGWNYDSAAIALENTEPVEGEEAGNITLTNNGDIDAPNIEMGIAVDSAGTATVTNTGEITARFSGIDVDAKGAVVVSNSGTIEVTEYNADGIATDSWTSDTVTNSGKIIASDAGIRAGGPGNTTVTNDSDGEIYASDGIEIGNGAGAIVTNSGTIESDETGITAVTFGGSTSYEEDGEVIDITVPGGEVNVTNSGTITMATPNSYDGTRYELNGHTLYTASNVGILAISMNGGAEVDLEYDENGQPFDDRFEFIPAADDLANNAVSVTNTGTIDGTGSDQSNGIYAMASDGVEINNSGDIMVAEGAIYVIGNSPVTISNSGTIRVTGEFGNHAVIANSGHEFLGHLGQAVSVTNSGTIDLTGAGHYRRAIRASSNGGSVTITNSGSVITTADGARGLHALSGSDGYCNFGETDTCNRPLVQAGGTVTINSSGSVSTAGTDAPAIRGNSAGGAVNINTSGTVTTIGDHAGAIRGVSGSTGSNMMTIPSPGGTVTINNAAKVQTAGLFSPGIRGFSNGGNVDVTNEGAITITGNDSHGVSLRSGNNWIGDDSKPSEGGTVTLTNNVGGNVSTGGDNSFAIDASSSTGNVAVVNRANLSTTGIHSRGINGSSGSNRENDDQVPFVGGNVAITNSGTISTQGFDSKAIEGWSNGGMVTVSNSGTVTTAGDDSVGLGIFSGTNRTEDDRVVTEGGNVTGTNSGTVSTTGNFSRAIELWTNGGDIQADLTASSNVSTTGDDSHGLSAYTGNTRTEGGRVPLAGGDITANLAGSISTEGRDSWALDIATPGGDITFMSKATLSTGGENARAINLSSGDERSADGRVPAAGGTITATNLGNLSTLGANSNGFMAYSHGGTVSGTNAGKITTSGLHSRGIDLRSGNDWIANGDEPRRGGNVMLTNNVGGDISTSGDESNAMQAASSTGNIVVSNSAVISTIGDESHGVAGFGGSNRDNDNQVVFVGGSVSVANSGSITTKGLDSNGMEGWSNGGAVTATNTGTISTAGADSIGMAAYSGTNRTLDSRVVQSGSDITLSNSGSVSTSGNSSTGVEAFSYGGAVQVDLTSSSVISTSGNRSHGLGVYSGNSFTTGGRVPRAGGTIVVNLNGKISTRGAHSDGVSTGTYGGNITLTNNATITASGSSSEGLYVASGSLGETGQVAHNGGTVTINNNSRVAVSGVDSSAIRTYSPNGTVNINNTGVLSSAKGKSIVVAAAARTAITNSGSLQGGATLHNGSDTLTNTGTLNGDFDFSGGNDTLNLNAGSVHGGAHFDGGAGIDTANLNDAGELTGTFEGFETGNLASGSWTLSNSWGSFDTVNTSNGSELTLNGGNLVAEQFNLVVGSILRGTGTISGGLTNDGSILLSSSDTLKIAGNLHSSAGSTIGISVGGTNGTSHSKIEVTGGQFTFDSSDVLNISVDADTDLSGGSTYQIATADGGVDDLSTADDSVAVEINDNSSAFSFERTISGNTLWVAVSSAISDVVSKLDPGLSEEANVIEELIVESGNGGELAKQLNGLSDEELVVAVREITAPNEAAGSQALSSTVNTANRMVNTRISSRVSSGRRGFNIGGRTSRSSYNADIGETEVSRVVMAYGTEGLSGSRWLDSNGYSQAWVQAFWGFSGIEDADSNQYGSAIGLDFRPDDSILLGGTFSYSRSDSDASNSTLEADSYGGMLYGAKGFDTGLSLSGVVGYFRAENETRRAAFRSVYSGEYDTNTFTVSGNIAQEIEMASWLFTPNAGVRYAHASFDTYTETGGPAPQTISRDDLNSVELSAQASFARSFDITATQQGLFEIHAGTLYEVGDSNSTVSYRFSPTGSVLTSQAGVPRLKFNVGTSVDVALTDQISTEFAYEGTFASDYSDHLLRAKFMVKF